MHIDKICFSIYFYSPKCFFNHHQGVTQEHIQYTNSCTKCLVKTTSFYSYTLSPPCGNKLSNYATVRNK
jgi:hypothetical protein